VILDCDTCSARGPACTDCVVTVLLGAPPAWDVDETRALGVLADSGLVPPLRLVPGASSGAAVSDDTPPGRRQAV
jgi:hypothetical protein